MYLKNKISHVPFSFLLLNTILSAYPCLMIFLSQTEAKEFDKWLMSPSGTSYTLSQLMEGAGLTIALIISKNYSRSKRIFFAIGPGNNGGDGLVAARYLALFNYSVTIYKPKTEKSKSEFFDVT